MRIVICKEAENHPDGTYSIVRGGIDRFNDPVLPFTLRAAMLIEATIDEIPHGEHESGLFRAKAPLGSEYRPILGHQAAGTPWQCSISIK